MTCPSVPRHACRLTDATANFQAPFRAHSWPVDRFFYLAELVLLPAYRDQGIGKAFFAMREAHIRAASTCDYACFCTVQRSDNHPLRPAAPAPLPGFHSTMQWKELGKAETSNMTMQFWDQATHRGFRYRAWPEPSGGWLAGDANRPAVLGSASPRHRAKRFGASPYACGRQERPLECAEVGASPILGCVGLQQIEAVSLNDLSYEIGIAIDEKGRATIQRPPGRVGCR